MTPSVTEWTALCRALLDFERAPGRHAVARQQPQPLFKHTHTVLQLAAGRTVPTLQTERLDAETQTALRRAARYFVRAALLRPGAHHHAVLGLAPGCDAEAVREHYRLMISMTHPDFAGSGETWPADAAARINLANQWLSSAINRQTTTDDAPRRAVPVPRLKPPGMALRRVGSPKSRKPSASDERQGARFSRRATVACTGMGATLAVGALVLMGTSGAEHSLAMRKVAPQPTPVIALDLAVTAQQAPEPINMAMSPAAATLDEARMRVFADPMSLVLAPQPVNSPAPLLAAVAVPAPQAPAAPTRLTLADVQPTFSQLLASLPGARGELLTQWVGADWRTSPANLRFENELNRLMAGQQVLQVGPVQLQASRFSGQLVVDGVVQLQLQNGNQPLQQKDLRLRAHFEATDGRPVLTQLATEGWR